MLFLAVITTRAFELKIGRRVPISRFVADNGRYSALNHWDQLSVSSRSRSLCTTPSMSNISFSAGKFPTIAGDGVRYMVEGSRGGVRDWITAEFSRPNPVNVSMSIKRLVDLGLRTAVLEADADQGIGGASSALSKTPPGGSHTHGAKPSTLILNDAGDGR
jgi:hypothetical protein